MAEFLMVRADKAGATPNADAMQYKAGDVVTIQDDGWPWSANELGLFDLVKVPGATQDDLSALLMPRAVDPVGGTLAQRRAFTFDRNTWLANGRPLPITRGTAIAMIVARPKVQDPAIIA